jgi:dienelactone hydrolase
MRSHPRFHALAAMLLSLAACFPAPGDEAQPAPTYPDHMNLLLWRDAKGVEHPVKTPQDWERRKAHIRANMQAVMGPLPSPEQRAPLEVQVISTEELPDVIRKKITYAGTNGYRVPAYLLIPKGIQGRAPAMLCLHGTSGSRGRTAGLGEDYPRYALELAQRGYVTIAPDYTLLGENQTDPVSVGFASGTMMGIWSHLRAVDLLQTLPEVDPERIGAIGVSLGGHNALFAGAFDGRLKVIVSSSGFDSFHGYMGGDLSGWCQPRYMMRVQEVYGKDPAKVPFDFPEVLAVLAPRHLYVHAPRSDSNFRVGSVQRCLAAAAEIYKLLGAADHLAAVYPPGGHGFPSDARTSAYEYIDGVLKSW